MQVISPQKRTAVVLFNLGGPSDQKAVQPFLFNLFNDPAIIRLPNPFRWLLAKLISSRRAPTAQKIYDELGGRSPILENTEVQAAALEASLKGHGAVKVFIAMRYWHPRADETARAVKGYAPDHVILLPMYPQFSTTTTGSSLKEWQRAAKACGLDIPTSTVCCYATQPQFITAHAQLVRTYYEEAARFGIPRILFSAHGLPESIVKAGDPYQWQVEQTADNILKELARDEVDYVNCYQSKVGPMKWLSPSTESEILRAAHDRVPVVVVPIAFVSEHSETLVELDMEYAELAHKNGLDRYYRVPTLSAHAHFIAALADLCLKQASGGGCASHTGGRFCPKHFAGCAMKGTHGLLPAH